MPQTLERTRRQLLDYMAREISTADLARINKTFPNLLAEAVREVNGEIEYGPINPDRYDD